MNYQSLNWILLSRARGGIPLFFFYEKYKVMLFTTIAPVGMGSRIISLRLLSKLIALSHIRN